MKRIIGLTMMIDGVWQAMAVSAVLSTIVDRSLRDQSLAAAHVIVGAALLFAGRQVYVGPNFSSAKIGGTEVPPYVRSLPIVAALAVSLIEATWFDWVGTAVRAVYTVIALVIVFRKTTLPTT